MRKAHSHKHKESVYLIPISATECWTDISNGYGPHYVSSYGLHHVNGYVVIKLIVLVVILLIVLVVIMFMVMVVFMFMVIIVPNVYGYGRHYFYIYFSDIVSCF